ncbi:unnamed protein product [Rhodiola kirilowii]
MEIFSGKCRKHPINNQQPGICSACLRDRLLQLADAYNHNTTLHTKSTDRDRYSSFSSTSTSSSPIYFSNFTTKSSDRPHAKHARNASDVVKSISYVVTGRGELKKSRSIAGEVRDKRRSFWKKLLMIKDTTAFGKSRTLRDRFVE